MRRRNMPSSSSNSRNTSTPNSLTSPSKKPSKYRAKKVELDGLVFDSKKEAARYAHLKILQRGGEISDLQIHPRYELKVKGQLICRYIADFSYIPKDAKGPHQRVVEDVKGMKKGGAWDIFRIKAKLMKAIHGVDVQVI